MTIIGLILFSALIENSWNTAKLLIGKSGNEPKKIGVYGELVSMRSSNKKMGDPELNKASLSLG
jgi:hypothetical protein